MRGIDAIWLLRVLAAAKRLVAMAMWQSYTAADEVEAMIRALDRAPLAALRPLPPARVPIARLAQRQLRYGVGAYADDLALLLRAHLPHYHWRRNPAYARDPRTAKLYPNYGYVELIGHNGYCHSDSVALGFLALDRDTHYPFHAHPAHEVYYVISGHGYFKQPDKPWRSAPANQFAFHPGGVPHALETRADPLLALYIWRGTVATPATLVDPVATAP